MKRTIGATGYKRVDPKQFERTLPPKPPKSLGRKRGSRNKLGEQFLLDLQAVWEQRGPKIIARVAEEKPHELLKVIANLLPRQLHVQLNQLEEFNDEQLEQMRQMLEEKVKTVGQSARKLAGPDIVDAEVLERQEPL